MDRMMKKSYLVYVYQVEADNCPCLVYDAEEFTKERACIEACKVAAKQLGGFWKDYYATVGNCGETE